MSKSTAKDLVETLTSCQLTALTSSIEELPEQQQEAFVTLMRAGRIAIEERDEYIARIKNKNRNYRLQLKQLNRAHTLQKREFERLKQQYDDLIEEPSVQGGGILSSIRPVEDELGYGIGDNAALYARPESYS
jgi:hypothetical protein